MLKDVNLHLVESLSDVDDFLRWLGQRHSVLAFDTETTGLNAFEKDAKIRLIQVGDTNDGWAIPWDGYGALALDALEMYEGPIVAHNSAFDIRWMEHHSPAWRPWKAPWHRLHDTMIMAHLIDSSQSVGLKELGVRLLDRNANQGEKQLKEAMHKNKWGWNDVPVQFEAYWIYSALDVVLTSRLYEMFSKKIADSGWSSSYEIEMAVRRVCSKMEDNGCPVDIDYINKKYDELGEYVVRTKQWGQENYGINLTSSQQVIGVLQAQGAEFTKMTPGGAPSADKEQLSILAIDYPLAQQVLDMRKAEKLAGTYLRNLLEMQVDGIVHPSIRTVGARSGRMSITSPALQTLPKGESLIRDAFIPRPGHKILSSDYDQVELRLMAYFSQDAGLRDAFSGGDFFVNLARNIFHEPDFQKADKRRGIVKAAVYAKLYGGGATKISAMVKRPKQEIETVLRGFDTAYPGIKTFMAAVESTVMERLNHEGMAYVNLPHGRRLICDEDRAYAAVNMIIQGTAALIFKDALVRLDNAGYGDYLLVPVHDEVVMSLPEEDFADAMVEVPRLLQPVTDPRGREFPVPLTADASGPLSRWGEKTG